MSWHLTRRRLCSRTRRTSDFAEKSVFDKCQPLLIDSVCEHLLMALNQTRLSNGAGEFGYQARPEPPGGVDRAPGG